MFPLFVVLIFFETVLFFNLNGEFSFIRHNARGKLTAILESFLNLSFPNETMSSFDGKLDT